MMNLLIKNYIEIGNIKIYFYGLIIAFAAFFALAVALKDANKLGINKDHLIYGFCYGLILGIIGARLYSCFLLWDYYREEPLKIITDIRSGGLAIHGGIIVAFVFGIIYSITKKMPVMAVLEVIAVGLLIGQIIGRWGNFFNQEAHGTLVPGATINDQVVWLKRLGLPNFIIEQMYIVDEGGYCHPTFLYESFWNFLGLTIILCLRRFSRHYWVGDASIIYLVWYGIGRFFLERYRTDALLIGNTNIMMAQVISIVMIIVGIILFILRRIYKYHPYSYKEYQRK